MKNKKLFDETVDILVKAYMNGTLEHANCQACAVGNIIAHKKGMKLIFSESFGVRTNEFWLTSWYETINGSPTNEGVEELRLTRYTIKEVRKIEKAFEWAGYNGDKDGYNGLMAVVEVLCQIHECEDIKEETKALFVR